MVIFHSYVNLPEGNQQQRLNLNALFQVDMLNASLNILDTQKTCQQLSAIKRRVSVYHH